MSLNRISRRDALLALGVAAMRQARADGGLLRATRVDHVALAVGDIDKALVFYRSLFGNEVLKDSRTPRRYCASGCAIWRLRRLRRVRPNGSIILASALPTSMRPL
jgi:catechol-2,3-dioxygenase